MIKKLSPQFSYENFTRVAESGESNFCVNFQVAIAQKIAPSLEQTASSVLMNLKSAGHNLELVEKIEGPDGMLSLTFLDKNGLRVTVNAIVTFGNEVPGCDH